MAFHIKKDDVVVVLWGDHKGDRGKVLRVDRERGRVVVEGVNMVYRHVRPSRRNPQGGRIRKEAPIPVCKVLPVDPKHNRGLRVHFELEKDSQGKLVKKRVSSRGTVLSVLSKAAE